MSRPSSTESVFRAIAHPSRRRMLELLGRKQWAACDLVEEFHHSQPTVSNHLRILHGAGLVEFERRGRHLMYGLSPGALAPVQEWIVSLPAAAIKSSKSFKPSPPSRKG